MTREKPSKQELSKKNAVGISVNPIYAYGEHWCMTNNQGDCPYGEVMVVCSFGGNKYCNLGDYYCQAPPPPPP